MVKKLQLKIRVLLSVMLAIAIALIAISAIGSSHVSAFDGYSPDVECYDYPQYRSYPISGCTCTDPYNQTGRMIRYEVRTCNTCEPWCDPWYMWEELCVDVDC